MQGFLGCVWVVVSLEGGGDRIVEKGARARAHTGFVVFLFVILIVVVVVVVELLDMGELVARLDLGDGRGGLAGAGEGGVVQLLGALGIGRLVVLEPACGQS